MGAYSPLKNRSRMGANIMITQLSQSPGLSGKTKSSHKLGISSAWTVFVERITPELKNYKRGKWDMGNCDCNTVVNYFIYI